MPPSSTVSTGASLLPTSCDRRSGAIRGTGWTRLANLLSLVALIVGLLVATPGVSSAGTTPSTNWSEQSPAVSPSVRSYSMMTYDSAISKMILFGGIDYLIPTYDQTPGRTTDPRGSNRLRRPARRAVSGA